MAKLHYSFNMKLEPGHYAGIVAVVLLLLGLGLYLGGVRNIAGVPLAGAGDFAFGYLAAGNFPIGVFAAGIFAAGIFSAGVFSIGVFAIGIFSIGVFSLGTFAVGIYAVSQMRKTEEK